MAEHQIVSTTRKVFRAVRKWAEQESSISVDEVVEAAELTHRNARRILGELVKSGTITRGQVSSTPVYWPRQDMSPSDTDLLRELVATYGSAAVVVVVVDEVEQASEETSP